MWNKPKILFDPRGNKASQESLVNFALHQRGILRDLMKFQNLTQDQRIVRLQDGSIIHVSSVFGQDVVRISCPSAVKVTADFEVFNLGIFNTPQATIPTECLSAVNAAGGFWRIVTLDFNNSSLPSFPALVVIRSGNISSGGLLEGLDFYGTGKFGVYSIGRHTLENSTTYSSSALGSPNVQILADPNTVPWLSNNPQGSVTRVETTTQVIVMPGTILGTNTIATYGTAVDYNEAGTDFSYATIDTVDTSSGSSGYTGDPPTLVNGSVTRYNQWGFTNFWLQTGTTDPTLRDNEGYIVKTGWLCSFTDMITNMVGTERDYRKGI